MFESVPEWEKDIAVAAKNVKYFYMFSRRKGVEFPPSIVTTFGLRGGDISKC